MSNKKLNPELLGKMVRKTGKSKQYLREQMSRRASRHGVSSLAAQLLWARELGIGITSVLNRTDPSVREEVRSSPTALSAVTKRPGKQPAHSLRPKRDPNLGAAIDFLVQDSELRGRCRDLLLAKRHYDRVVREATTVLDNRLKKVSGISNMNPSALVGKVLAPDPTKAVIIVSADKGEQEGFFYICKGVMEAFRNKAHHNLTNSFTQADALRFCGFIDTILAVIDKGEVHPERI
jgi:uncharacterized protein (TIGR02391 family)